MDLFKKSIVLSLFSLLLVMASLTDLYAQNQEMTPQVSGDDVITVLNESADHTIFAQLIDEAQLTETIQQPGPYTILAPKNEALEELGSELNELRESPDQLQNVVINHLFTGEASATEVEESFGVEVEEGDMEASNGVVHSIDEVRLTP